MKEFKIYNSLTDKVEVFKPIEEGKVSMYVCGPTVYNSPHVGNSRPPIVFDCLRRTLQYIGYDVTYVSNFTDVDDKIINKAIEEGVAEKVISERYIAEYKKMLEDLNILPATVNPRVTEYMEPIINYIADLIDTNHAYYADGDVYFKVDSIEGYGELSNINIEDLMVGARIEDHTKKQSPLDFALWKKTDKGIKWDCKIGCGRPGWHTECCVMINNIFPNHKIDIHGGGFDLKFPHHENEIAQSKAHDNNKLANYWVHNGFINIDNEKMSKSLGNVLLAKDLIAKFGGNVLRMLMLTAHYRAPLNFTMDAITNCQNELNKIEMAVKQLTLKLQLADVSLDDIKEDNIETFIDAMCDDLNVANAMSELFNQVKKANQDLRTRDVNIDELKKDFGNIKTMLSIVGIKVNYVVLNDEDKSLYKEYLALKAEKRFEESDVIRQKLIERKIL